MDERRMSTGECIASGILGKQLPQHDVPTDRDRVCLDDDHTDAVIAKLLDEGKVIESPNYYGIPVMWKAVQSFRIILFQYREITESLTFDDLESTVKKFRELVSATE